MLTISPSCPSNLRWEYPLDLGTDQVFNNLDLDSMFFANVSSSQDHDYQDNQDNNDHIRRSESPQGTSSTDHFDNNNPLISKKLNHNACERDRRKKINNMYSSLRALLPASDQKKKLSIPATVGRVLEYIPQLQKQVEKLTYTKDALLSKLSALQGNAGDLIQEQKQTICLTNETTSFSASANKLGDNELVVHISSFERISMFEVLLLCEKNGYLVIDVSSFQSFGGRTFYNVHLWIDGSNNVNFEKLSEALMKSLVQNQQMQMQIQMPMQVYY